MKVVIYSSFGLWGSLFQANEFYTFSLQWKFVVYWAYFFPEMIFFINQSPGLVVLIYLSYFQFPFCFRFLHSSRQFDTVKNTISTRIFIIVQGRNSGTTSMKARKSAPKTPEAYCLNWHQTKALRTLFKPQSFFIYEGLDRLFNR